MRLCMRELTRISHQTVVPEITAPKVRRMSARSATTPTLSAVVYGQVAGSCPRTSRTKAWIMAGFAIGERTSTPPKSARGRITATAIVSRTTIRAVFFGAYGVTGFAVIDRSPARRRRDWR
jgi:hypothetical protein